MVWLFGVASFLGAALLFVVEPLVAKSVLPAFGGSPMVWNTCTFFFQAMLLAAYVFVHASARRLGRRQVLLHLPLLVVSLLALPLAAPTGQLVDTGGPFLDLLRLLLVLVGLPFAVLATTGPVLQRWFAWTRHRRAADPFFLYAASNAGSFVGLLAYPLLLEPALPAAGLRSAWSGAFVVFAGLITACGLVALRSRELTAADAGAAVATAAVATPVAWSRRARWLGLAFLPSSLMLGMTSFVTADVASVPLLWVLPLAIYLATFVAAFASRRRRVPAAVPTVAAALALPAWLTSQLVFTLPVLLTIGFHLTAFAAIAYAAHARLAADRPEANRLTEFYVVVSAGGALGGAVNGLLAPIALDRSVEYPLVLAAVPLLGVGLLEGRSLLDRLPHLALRLATVVGLGGLALLGALGVVDGRGWAGLLMLPALAGVGAVLAPRPRVTAALLLLGLGITQVRASADVLHQSRTFFGVYRVTGDTARHELANGTTSHGSEHFAPDLRGQPTSYYTAAGPVGDVLPVGRERLGRVGVVGLGVGQLAAYALPAEDWTFYEIDPEVLRIARDPDLFTFLSRARADVSVRVGDGRLLVAAEPAGALDLLVLDAFSSDAVPVHLLTREALATYLSRVAADGAVVVHISNRYFDLRPVLRAATADLGGQVVFRTFAGAPPDVQPSSWAVLTRSPDWVARLTSAGWAVGDAEDRVEWTDDHSSLLRVLRRAG